MNTLKPFQTSENLTEKHQSQSTLNLWEWVGLAIILILGAALRLWDLDKNGTGNPYYASAVRSMMMNWHNFFFVSFDPVGFVTVDKPPVSLWIQTAFSKLFGYRGFTLILPQVLEGLGTLTVVFYMVRRRFGAFAAQFAGLVVALSPVSVAVDRFNNTDECLVFILALAAWALIRAAETGSRKLLYLAMILVGIGFNTKMMAAFVALPVFYLVYLIGSPTSWFKRIYSLSTGTLILLIVALSWPLAVDLTPPEQRPFVGSTQDNSMISLSLGWNGFQRLLTRGRRGFPPNGRGGNFPMTGTTTPPPPNSSATLGDATNPDVAATSQAMARRRNGGFMNNGTPGPLRLADRNMAGQVGWFIPLALLGFYSASRRSRWTFPLGSNLQNLVFWLGWIFIYGAVFSFMKGAMHPYYLVLMVPAIAALAGIGVQSIWKDYQEGRIILPLLALALTSAWQAFIVAQYPDWKHQLLPVLISGSLLSLVVLLVISRLASPKLSWARWAPAVFGLGLLTLFLCPTFWALTPVWGSGQSVQAGPDLLNPNSRSGLFPGFGINLDNSKLLGYLKAHHQGEAYLLVAQNSQLVAPIIIETGEPVVAIGGFMGGDPILTANQFALRVQEGQFRYMLLNVPSPNQGGKNPGGNPGGWSGLGGLGRMGGAQAEISKWAWEHGKPVNPALWKPMLPPVLSIVQSAAPGGFGGRRGGIANLQLYDLRPDKAAKKSSKG
jgi:4-amino-4-deoxy-L-arabinose transferase-like glycosyltransferase